MTIRWEHFTHEADVGVRGIGNTIGQAFEQAALALTGIVTDLDRVRPAQPVEIACAAPDRELLLVDWLNALIFEMAVRRMLFSRFAVTLTGSGLKAVAIGEPIDVSRHRPVVEPKGATYTALGVSQLGDGSWRAQCVIDV